MHRNSEQLAKKIANKKTCTWLQNRNVKRDIKTLLIEAENNAIRNNYFRATIDDTQQNS